MLAVVNTPPPMRKDAEVGDQRRRAGIGLRRVLGRA